MIIIIKFGNCAIEYIIIFQPTLQLGNHQKNYVIRLLFFLFGEFFFGVLESTRI